MLFIPERVVFFLFSSYTSHRLYNFLSFSLFKYWHPVSLFISGPPFSSLELLKCVPFVAIAMDVPPVIIWWPVLLSLLKNRQGTSTVWEGPIGSGAQVLSALAVAAPGFRS